jgi:methylglutaconyl-CoA hydratase
MGMQQSFPTGYVQSVTENNITTIEFYHPQSNSLPGSLLMELAKAIQTAGEENDAAVIVLKSHGNKTFCAGASFDELLQIKTEAEGLVFFSGFAKVINAIRCCPKFVIAQIQGKCVGGGVGLAAAADYAIATEAADVKLSELAVGIGPFVVGPAVERKIGSSAFHTLSIDASSWRSSDWAYTKGLFAELHPSIEAMEKSIAKLAHTLSNSSPLAMEALKKICWKGTEHWNELLLERAAISGKLILSDFSKKAIEKFKAK